jgi:hypothetical protein
MGTPTQGQYCIVHGMTVPEGAFIEGPFTTEDDAQKNAADDQKSHPDISATVVPLVDPATC